MLGSELRTAYRSSRLGSQSGMAIFEVIPVLVIFVIFVTYTYGFFGAIHSGILTSIAARNYTFETFRHRSNLKYFRGNKYKDTSTYIARYTTFDVRFHGVTAETTKELVFAAPVRNISFIGSKNKFVNNSASAEDYHNEDIVRTISPGKRFNQSDGVNPIWLKIQYGICMTSQCGASRE